MTNLIDWNPYRAYYGKRKYKCLGCRNMISQFRKHKPTCWVLGMYEYTDDVGNECIGFKHPAPCIVKRKRLEEVGG